jgi:hypothetical protein
MKEKGGEESAERRIRTAKRRRREGGAVRK